MHCLQFNRSTHLYGICKTNKIQLSYALWCDTRLKNSMHSLCDSISICVYARPGRGHVEQKLISDWARNGWFVIDSIKIKFIPTKCTFHRPQDRIHYLPSKNVENLEFYQFLVWSADVCSGILEMSQCKRIHSLNNVAHIYEIYWIIKSKCPNNNYSIN